MTTFQKFQTEDRRLSILQLLKESDGSANESVLHTGLEALGHRKLPRDTIREDIRHLINNGVITDEWPANGLQVCILTRRGVDAAEGRILVEGIRKPPIGT